MAPKSSISVPIVVVADSDAIHLRTMDRYLREEFGLQPLLATNGDEAKKLLQRVKADVVYLDLSKPLFTGIEVARWLRRENQIQKAKIIGMASSLEIAKEEAALFSEILTKPVSRKELKRTLAPLF